MSNASFFDMSEVTAGFLSDGLCPKGRALGVFIRFGTFGRSYDLWNMYAGLEHFGEVVVDFLSVPDK